MKMLRLSLFALALSLIFSMPVFAQWQTPLHSVPIGLGAGTTGFTSASPTVAGQVFMDNGPTADPSFRPMTVFNSFGTSHTISSSDCYNVVQMGTGSSWPLTLTLPANPLVNGFSGACPIRIIGQASRGILLSGFTGLGLTSPNILWPTKAFSIGITPGGAWVLTAADGRWKIPNNTTLYADANNGNNANDCLAPGTGNACQTMSQALRGYDKDYFDRSGASGFPNATLNIQLADNASGGNCTALCYSLTDIAYVSVGGEGRGSTIISGNAANPQNVVLADAGAYGIDVFRNSVEIQNLQFGQTNCAATPKANSGISVIEGGVVFLQGTIYLGCVSQAQIGVGPGGYFDSNARPINVVAGGSWAFYNDGGQLRLSGQSGTSTVTFSNSPVYSQQVFNSVRGAYTSAGANYVNGATVTSSGGKLNCNAGWIETDGVTLPGTGSTAAGPGCTVF